MPIASLAACFNMTLPGHQMSGYPADESCPRIHLRLELRERATHGYRQWTMQCILPCDLLLYADVGCGPRYLHRYADTDTDTDGDPPPEAKADELLSVW